MAKSVGIKAHRLTDEIAGYKIHIPDHFPKLKKSMNSDVKQLWTAYVHEGINQLQESERIKIFHKAAVVLDIHIDMPYWDTDNRGYNIIINALKGTFYSDDSWDRVSLSMCGKYDKNFYIDIYILDDSDDISYVNLKRNLRK